MAENLENLNPNPEEDDDLIELVDEEGETTLFELLASFDFEGAHYLAVSEPTEEEDPESMQVIMLKTAQDEDGQDTYVTIDDDDESEAAFNYFLTLVEAEAEEDGE